MKRIGERVKKRREMQNLHLNTLAERVGISPSALSQIEKAKSFPSILTLKSIAENLHTTVGDLIGENESLANNPIVKISEEKFIDKNNSGASIYLLSHHDVNKQMDTCLVRFALGATTDGLFTNQIGQIYCRVLAGEICFELEGKSYTMQVGDNIYFNAKMTYHAVNTFNGESELLWIQSPPGF